jgi:hypothetical protein
MGNNFGYCNGLPFIGSLMLPFVLSLCVCNMCVDMMQLRKTKKQKLLYFACFLKNFGKV